MAVYLITDADWKDASRDTIQAFGRAAQPVLIAHGGTFLTQPNPPAVMEGAWTPRVLMIVEFPDAEAVQRLWDSPEYQAAADIRREAGADFKVVLVDGV